MPAKGHTNNPKGKPKGTKSTKTLQWEAIAEYLTDEGAEKAKKILMKMNDESFMRNYLQILEYFKPKQARIESEVSVVTPLTVNIKPLDE